MHKNTQQDIDTLYTQSDPSTLFDQWFALAQRHEVNDANAMSLATVSANGIPDVRIVLLKDKNEDGFIFFTNYHSQKADDMFHNPYASLGFYWKSLHRQIRIKGYVQQTSSRVSDAYFATRPRDNQLGAWSSLQSTLMDNKNTFVKRFNACKERFANTVIERPPHWGGYSLMPQEIEFWIAHENRLHNRVVFVRAVHDSEQSDASNVWCSMWNKKILYP